MCEQICEKTLFPKMKNIHHEYVRAVFLTELKLNLTPLTEFYRDPS